MGEKQMSVQFTDNSDKVLSEFEQAIARALERIGSQAEGYAKDLCPVDTGRLRNSITNKVEESEESVYIGTNVEYASFVELGTVKQKAQPYLKPAVANHAKTYENIIKDEMKNS